MKKLVIVFISIMIISFILISYMVFNNNKYTDDLEKRIKDNTDILFVNYINEYGDYYIVMDSEYLYLINKEYKIIFDIDISMIHENTRGYDIIYEDETLMYFCDKYDDGVVYEYYDLYTYEIIDKIVIGDKNE